MSVLTESKKDHARSVYRTFCNALDVDPEAPNNGAVRIEFGVRDRVAGVFEVHLYFEEDPDLSEAWTAQHVGAGAHHEHTFYGEPSEESPKAVYVVQFRI